MESFRFASHMRWSREFEVLKRMIIAAIVSHHQAMRDVEQSLLPRWIRLNSWNLNSLEELIVRL